MCACVLSYIKPATNVFQLFHFPNFSLNYCTSILVHNSVFQPDVPLPDASFCSLKYVKNMLKGCTLLEEGFGFVFFFF